MSRFTVVSSWESPDLAIPATMPRPDSELLPHRQQSVPDSVRKSIHGAELQNGRVKQQQQQSAPQKQLAEERAR